MAPVIAAPLLDGEGESSPGYPMEPGPWCKEADPQVRQRASASVLQGKESTARDVNTALGNGEPLEPDALDAAYRDASRSSRSKRATQTTDTYQVKFD